MIFINLYIIDQIEKEALPDVEKSNCFSSVKLTFLPVGPQYHIKYRQGYLPG